MTAKVRPGDKKRMPRTSGKAPKIEAEPAAKAAAAPLLAWYDVHARVLPWRARKGEQADPYAVWLSEIMLQQTTVATVGPYFMRFLARWPNVEALAAAPQEEVMKEWAGLGYYSRARNLHACARTVSSGYGGKFPADVDGLSKLPGIGPCTAAAIAAIALGKPATVVDGNVERVVARLFALRTPLPQVKPEIRAKAATLTPAKRAGDFAQAMMDLGATICTPKNPACNRCPLEAMCDAKGEGVAALLPVRAPKKERPVRRGACFWLTKGDHVWLRRRPDKGLLGGMMEVPGSPWDSPDAEGAEPGLGYAPLEAVWKMVPGKVEHTFTHFHLVLDVFTATTRKKNVPGRGEWVPFAALAGEALPTVMRKVAAHAMPDAGPLLAKR